MIRRAWGGGLGGRTGNALVISHGGSQYTYYGHLSAYRVALNATVKAGQRIADMGATGNVTGPHLHFETHTGGLGGITDPVAFMAARGVDLGGGWPRLDPGASGATVVVVQRLMTQRGHRWSPTGSTARSRWPPSRSSRRPRAWWRTARSAPRPGPSWSSRSARAAPASRSAPCRRP